MSSLKQYDRGEKVRLGEKRDSRGTEGKLAKGHGEVQREGSGLTRGNLFDVVLIPKAGEKRLCAQGPVVRRDVHTGLAPTEMDFTSPDGLGIKIRDVSLEKNLSSVLTMAEK